jgi:hypothetical protein
LSRRVVEAPLVAEALPVMRGPAGKDCALTRELLRVE